MARRGGGQPPAEFFFFKIYQYFLCFLNKFTKIFLISKEINKIYPS
jgi:hypothetical protein